MKHEWPIVETPAVGSRQWIFDRVIAHYRAQPRRCPESGDACWYRGDGNRCWVGALIDDAHYDRAMEGNPVPFLLDSFALPYWFRENIDFLDDLQRIHDISANWAPGVMPMVLARFAEEQGLRMLA